MRLRLSSVGSISWKRCLSFSVDMLITNQTTSLRSVFNCSFGK
jgi:hypothetical protein